VSETEADGMADEVSPKDLKDRLDRREPVTVLDVREAWERRLCSIEHSVHIPLEEIEHRVEELGQDEEIVVYCHHGVRSAAVVDYLRRLGFPRVRNLAGGVDYWARTVDPRMRRY
jgi:adenylyltransferase/sulfurtransferase